jgi:hypothetical protein
MGRLQAGEMKEHAGEHIALKWHLQHNHYPPVPVEWVPVCQKIISKYNDGDYNLNYSVLNPVRDDEMVSAVRVVEALHLGVFLEEPENDDEI